MRILISGTTYHPALNGQAIFTVNLAEGLAKQGHEVVAVYPSEQGKAYSRTRNGVRLETVSSFSLSFLHPDSFVPLPSIKRVRQILDDFQPDIVHIQDHYPTCRSVVIESKKRKLKIVGTNHFMPENLAPYIPGLSKIKPLYNRLLWNWMLEVYNRVDVVTTQSRVAADIVRAQGLRVPVFPASCGIDLNQFRPDPSVDRLACRARYGLDPGRTIFLFVGRVDKEKRLDVLLRAFQYLKRDDIQLAIAGSGAELNELQALAKKLNLGERVRFTGFIHENLHVLLNSADIFTMPSEAELLSIASLEAMACGRPVLLADAVALPELVTQGVNGYLFKPGDSKDAAHFMELLADQSERWDEMGRAGVEKAQYHSLENTIKRYEALYKDALKKTS
ncbi:MAG: glycosyltransferase [Chloroflexi bacterium]|nr:glycosyltransferase [Chloroflexota bacterium]MBI3340078.1 glycosyltransferase [Chloroflexota bacterium]